MNPAALLSVEDLRVRFPEGEGWSEVVRGVSFELRPREFVGLVGESGSGKSLTALSILRLVPPPGAICGGRIRLGDTDLLQLPERAMRRVRGARIGMVFQEPASALNPVLTIGFQVAEAVRAHRRLSHREARQEALRLLDRVGLADARGRLSAYPHQLSGGQRQRVLIAVALASRPEVLLADEPTTALDATLQAQILDLLEDLRRDLGLSVLLITHDLGVVSAVCDRAVVLYRGEVVEQAETGTLFRSPAHPYTRSLIESLVPLRAPEGPQAPAAEAPILQVSGLSKEFRLRRSWWRPAATLVALRGVSLAVERRECLAIVGESGSGKTTLGRCMIRLVEPTKGEIRFADTDLRAMAPAELRRWRRRFQMIFQDPHGSLDPRQPVGRAVAEPLRVHDGMEGAPRRAAVAELLDQVGLSPRLAAAYPHQLSGGQRQRVGIARALACRPDLLIADEPTSALDALVRVQILRLLMDLRQRFELTLVLITHDLALVASVASRVAVFYLGQMVELAPVAELYARPQHPYTVSLLTAIPRGRAVQVPGGGGRLVLRGEQPDPLTPLAGCPFHPRCPVAGPRCAVEEPELAPLPGTEAGADGHRVACFHPGEVVDHNLFQV